jgi:phospholipid transport system substrate-binding protein
MKTIAALFFAAACLVSVNALAADATKAAATPAAPSVCEAFYTSMTKQVVDIFHDKSTSEEKKQRQLAILFLKAVDTDWIGKFVMGRFYKDAKPDDQKEYLETYRYYLTGIYVSKFENDDDSNYQLGDIKLISLTPKEDSQVSAKTIISRKGEPDVHVNYLLLQTDVCQVHDIEIEGVSLLNNQRSEFQALAGQSGMKAVIDTMKKRLAD